MSASLLTDEVLDLVRKLVRRNCQKFHVQISEEDVSQDIVVKLLTPSNSVHTTYLERFDSSKNSLAGFLSTFIYNYFCRLYSRLIHPVETAASIERVLPSIEPHVSFVPQVFHDKEKFVRIYNTLDSLYPYSSGVLLERPFAVPPRLVRIVYASAPPTPAENEELVWRSVANIFRFLFDGFSQEEIAVAMYVSRGWISKKVQLLRAFDEVADWAAEFDIYSDSDSL